MSDEKKIIIDEDWKSQVEAERAAAAAQQASQPAPADELASVGGATTKRAAADPSATADPNMPPASFELLVTTLATEALAALGQFPHPATGKAAVQRNHAQYLIDTLDILRQKTKGNLTNDEEQLIDSVLHQMRMLFVTVANQLAS